jgi:hypothetical protein
LRRLVVETLTPTLSLWERVPEGRVRKIAGGAIVATSHKEHERNPNRDN